MRSYLLLNGLYDELSMRIQRSELGQLKVPHIILDLGLLCSVVNEVVQNLQDRTEQDDEGELLENEIVDNDHFETNSTNHLIDHSSDTYGLHVFRSPFEHRKTSIGESKQKNERADPSEVEKRVGEHFTAEAEALLDQIGRYVAQIERTAQKVEDADAESDLEHPNELRGEHSGNHVKS